MFNGKQSRRAERRRYGSVRRVRWISVIKFREGTHAMLAEVLIESFHKPFGLLDEGRSLDAEGNLYIRIQQARTGAALMVGKIPVPLGSFIHLSLIHISEPTRPY